MRLFPTLLLFLLAACSKHTKQAPVVAALEKLADSPSKMVLYSVHPGMTEDYKDFYDDQSFHGYVILGKAEITDRNEQRTLLRALARSGYAAAFTDCRRQDCINLAIAVGATQS